MSIKGLMKFLFVDMKTVNILLQERLFILHFLFLQKRHTKNSITVNMHRINPKAYCTDLKCHLGSFVTLDPELFQVPSRPQAAFLPHFT